MDGMRSTEKDLKKNKKEVKISAVIKLDKIT
jgi:hypothetical protein